MWAQSASAKVRPARLDDDGVGAPVSEDLTLGGVVRGGEAIEGAAVELFVGDNTYTATAGRGEPMRATRAASASAATIGPI